MKSVLTPEEAELVAIGAAIAATCKPCLNHHFGKAVELGISAERIAAAAAIGRGTRGTPAKHVDDLLQELSGSQPCSSSSSCCG